MNIIFFGTPAFAVPTLKKLIESGHNIVAVVCAPDEPVGRKGILTSPPVRILAKENNISALQPKSLKKDEEVFNKFKELNPDLCIVAAYGKIIPSRFLDIPKLGFINIHPSLLPKYRGPSPIQSAILNGDKETGVTIIKIDEEMDHGPILSYERYTINSTEYFEQIYKDLADLGASLLEKVLPKYLRREIKPKEQDHGKATYCKMISRENGKIDWNKTAKDIYNQIRALNPEPGTWTTWNGKTLNILEAKPLPFPAKNSKKVGFIEKMNGSIVVSAKNHYLIINKLQLEGKKIIDAKSFINGYPDFVGSELI